MRNFSVAGELPRYIVVGCNHGIQRREPISCFDDTTVVRQQRSCFKDFLAGVIEQQGIEFIGEEWGCPQATFAHALAAEHEIHYSNISTTCEDLKGPGIPADYLSGNYADSQKKAWLRWREGFMFGKIKKGQGDAQSVLVICGFAHMNPIADLLRRDCADVVIVDYRKTDWYQTGVFAED